MREYQRLKCSLAIIGISEGTVKTNYELKPQKEFNKILTSSCNATKSSKHQKHTRKI